MRIIKLFSFKMYICRCVYIMFMYMYVRGCIYKYLHVCMYVCMCVCRCMGCICVCIYMNVYVYVSVQDSRHVKYVYKLLREKKHWSVMQRCRYAVNSLLQYK